MATTTLKRQYLESVPGSPFINVLTDDGLPTGNFLATGDYSVTPQDFFFQAPLGSYVIINRIRFIVSDSGAPPGRNEYGNLGVALANGIRAFFDPVDEPEYEVTPGLRAIVANQDFERFATGLDVINYTGNDSRAYDIFLPGGIRLDGGDKFILRLNDSFTGLVAHQFALLGTERGIPNA